MSGVSGSDNESIFSGDAVFEHHCGVHCDWCGTQILGPHHHCRQCVDFDLCGACYREIDSIHPIHSFEVITGQPESVLGDDWQGNSVTWTPLTMETINEFEQICEITTSGVNEELVTKWIAEDNQWIDAKDVSQHDSSWVCPSCLTGLETDVHRSLVKICTGGGHWGHIFHRECLQEWLTISNTCPLCRRSEIISMADDSDECEVFL